VRVSIGWTYHVHHNLRGAPSWGFEEETGNGGIIPGGGDV